MFEARSIETKKNFIRLLFERVHRELNLAPANLEVTTTETPKHHRGFRGQPGDEISLNCKVEVYFGIYSRRTKRCNRSSTFSAP